MTGKIRRELGYEPSISLIKRILGPKAKIIAYFPVIARELNNKNAALLLQQLLYWQSRVVSLEAEGWFYKTIRELEDELDLSRHEQKTAIHLLIKHDLIEEQIKGIPPKRYFRVKIDNVIRFLREIRVEDEIDQNVRNQHNDMPKYGE